jgi:chorismate mutase/prephenate dehydratase
MDIPDNIQGCREGIDRLDDEILKLLNERSQYVIQIGHLKKQKDASAHLHTQGREVAIVERLMAQNPGPFPSEALRPVYRAKSCQRLCRWKVRRRLRI